MTEQKQRNWLIVSLLLGAGLRFYRLNWGEGYYFHPDENNIANSIAQLAPPGFHPHFFAYGQLPSYLVYFVWQLVFRLRGQNLWQAVSFSQAVWGIRCLAALSSLLTIWLVFRIGKRFWPKLAGQLAFWTAACPGLIQAAHFGTTESLLGLFLLTITDFSLSLQEKAKKKDFGKLGLTLGLGLGTKLNSLSFFLIPAVAAIGWKEKWPVKIKNWLKLTATTVLALGIGLMVSPYQILDWKEFRGSMIYELGVASGKMRVFYTRQFNDSWPFFFQLRKIFPYSLGWPLTVLGMAGAVLLIRRFWQKKERKIAILLAAAGISFWPNVFIFAKWTRFMTPAVPFLILLAGETVSQSQKTKLKNWLVGGITLISLIAGLSFFGIYRRPDVRITASEWMEKNLPAGSRILSEGGNVLNLPLTGNFETVNFDFYPLDDEPSKEEELRQEIRNCDYILVPSRRVFANHDKKRFPKTAHYYERLFDGSLGFEEVKIFTSYPGITIGRWRAEWPDENAEETWTVFDHPVIRVFAKKND